MPTGANAQEILENVRKLSAEFAQERRERQLGRSLDQVDFDRLRDAGFLLTAVPVDQGGIWESTQRSIRPVCEILRTLAHGDSSVALVSAMHPSIILAGGWLTIPEAPPPYREAWDQQRRWVFETACQGHQ